jgi:hypothetical protein
LAYQSRQTGCLSIYQPGSQTIPVTVGLALHAGESAPDEVLQPQFTGSDSFFNILFAFFGTFGLGGRVNGRLTAFGGSFNSAGSPAV